MEAVGQPLQLTKGQACSIKIQGPFLGCGVFKSTNENVGQALSATVVLFCFLQQCHSSQEHQILGLELINSADSMPGSVREQMQCATQSLLRTLQQRLQMSVITA